MVKWCPNLTEATIKGICKITLIEEGMKVCYAEYCRTNENHKKCLTFIEGTTK